MAGYPMGYNGMNPYGMQPGYGGMNYQPPQQPPMSGYPYASIQQQPAPIPQIQQPSVQQTMVLGGKPVDSLEVVKATDIPMDNATYYFPKPDGTEIYTKRWLPDGTSEIVTYKREIQPPSEETKQFMDGFLVKEDVSKMQDNLSRKLDSILDRVSRLEEAFK